MKECVLKMCVCVSFLYLKCQESTVRLEQLISWGMFPIDWHKLSRACLLNKTHGQSLNPCHEVTVVKTL